MKTRTKFNISVVCDIVLAILLILVIVFKPTFKDIFEGQNSIEDEGIAEDIDNSRKNLDIDLSPKEKDTIRAKQLHSRATRIDWTLKYPEDKFNTLVDVKFNECYSPMFVENNTTLYQVVSRYMNAELFQDTNFAEYVDPLYPLAVSNVEFGGTNDYNKLLAPALPTRSKIEITKDNILNFDYSDYLRYPELLKMDRDNYRGPLQMYVTGLEPILKEDIRSSEFEKLIVAEDSIAKQSELEALQFVEGSGVGSNCDGMRLKNKQGTYGDRYNYPDAVNRLCGYVHDNWKRYSDASFEKSGEYLIDNKFAWMAVSAVGHNASPGIYYLDNDKTLSSKYYWWPYSSFGSARKYCIALGKPECYNYIKDLAESNLSKYRHGESSLKFILNMNEGYDIAEQFRDKGYIEDGLYICTNSGHKEKIAYPIQVLYNYFMLRQIYSGY